MDNQVKLKVFGKEFIIDYKPIRIGWVYVYLLRDNGVISITIDGVTFDNASYAEKHLETQAVEMFERQHKNFNLYKNLLSKDESFIIYPFIQGYNSIKDLVPEIENYLILKEII